MAVSSASARAQTLQLDGDFESGELTGWRAEGSLTAQVVASPVRAGSYALNVHLGPTESDPKRAELTADTAGLMYYDNEYWLGFSTWIDSWNEPLPSWATLVQLHAVPGDENWSCVAGRNPFSLGVEASDVFVAVVDTPYLGPPPVPGGAVAVGVFSTPMDLGRWHDWILHLEPSLTDGVLEVWLDDSLIHSQTGGNVDAIDDCGVEQEPMVYLKIGIYKEYENTATESVNFDEVRIYQGSDGYDLVRPGGSRLIDGGPPADSAALRDAGAMDAASSGDAEGKAVDAARFADGPATYPDATGAVGGCGCAAPGARATGRGAPAALLMLLFVRRAIPRGAGRKPRRGHS